MTAFIDAICMFRNLMDGNTQAGIVKASLLIRIFYGIHMCGIAYSVRRRCVFYYVAVLEECTVNLREQDWKKVTFSSKDAHGSIGHATGVAAHPVCTRRCDESGVGNGAVNPVFSHDIGINTRALSW